MTARVRETGEACPPARDDDSDTMRCENFCKSSHEVEHCDLCKCKACDFCQGVVAHPPPPPVAASLFAAAALGVPAAQPRTAAAVTLASPPPPPPPPPPLPQLAPQSTCAAKRKGGKKPSPRGSGRADLDVPALLQKHFPQHGPFLGVYAQVVSAGEAKVGDRVRVSPAG